MKKLIAFSLLLALSVFGQGKTDPAGAPPSEVSALASALQKEGLKLSKSDGSAIAEVWFVAQEPKGGSAEDAASLPTFPQGALIGVVRFASKSSDRRGQTIQPGVYTLRYSRYPVNGDHMGVAPQRDFLLMSPAATDTDAAAQPKFEDLVNMSKKAAGTPHPAVWSCWKDDDGAKPGLEEGPENEVVLHTTVGSVKLAIIVAGAYQG